MSKYLLLAFGILLALMIACGGVSTTLTNPTPVTPTNPPTPPPQITPGASKIAYLNMAPDEYTSTINVMDSNAAASDPVTAHGQLYSAHSTPDGSVVVYSEYLPAVGEPRVFLWDRVNGDPFNHVQLSPSGRWSVDAQISSDGTKVLYNSVFDGIYIVNADGSGRTRVPGLENYCIHSPSLSPDATKIVFSYHEIDGNVYWLKFKLGIVNTDGSEFRTIPIPDEIDAILDPTMSDNRVFYSKSVTGGWQIHSANLDGTDEKVLTTTTTDGNFDPTYIDGRILFLARPAGSYSYLMRSMNLDGTDLKTLHPRAGSNYFHVLNSTDFWGAP